MTTHEDATLREAVTEVLGAFAAKTGLANLPAVTKERTEGHTLVIEIASPSERHYRAANEVAESLPAEHPFAGRISVRQRRRRAQLSDPEPRLLQQTLAGSATSDRHSFQGDLAELYIPTGSGAEGQIVADGNHLVFGRRGAGKSSLLVHALRAFERQRRPTAWIDMQTFEHRSDTGVVTDILVELLRSVEPLPDLEGQTRQLMTRLSALREGENKPSLDAIRRLAPDLKHLFVRVTERHGRFAVFLDDLHVIAEGLQPVLLGILYSFARGSRVDLKVSALEHFTRHWDAAQRLGLEVPGDAQPISLDYNLTNPKNALQHIRSILDAYARFCGLRSILAVCGTPVIERLMWLAAGVPRDALSILQQAMSSAAADSRRQVGVTDVNIAASTYVEDKNRYLGKDTSEGQDRVRALLERIKAFCITEQHRNAFLIRIGNEDGPYRDVLRLIDLRFLHVLNRGLTPGKAAEKYLALLLDYGFYTGFRKAKTVDVLQQTPGRLRYKTLRTLPKFDPSAALAQVR